MSSLPEALRPWASQLSLFPEDLALSVGAHVARLAAAIGPMRARNEAVGGELQGYDGLTRRGSPERLLISEWASKSRSTSRARAWASLVGTA